jgi:hypothetical protein
VIDILVQSGRNAKAASEKRLNRANVVEFDDNSPLASYRDMCGRPECRFVKAIKRDDVITYDDVILLQG